MRKPVLSMPHTSGRSPWRTARTIQFLILGFLLTCTGVAAITWTGSREETRHTPALVAGQVLPDAGGAIRDWLLCLPGGNQAFFHDTQAELVAKAHPSSRMHVVLAAGDDGTSFRQALVRHGVHDASRVTWHRPNSRVWPWVRDLFVAGRTSAGGRLAYVSGAEQWRGTKLSVLDTDFSEVIGAVPGNVPVVVDLFLEGGSVVSDEERIFVSEYVLAKALVSGFANSASRLRARLQALWGRPVEILPTRGTSYSEHCDLVLMPVGDRDVLVSSPRVAMDLLHDASAGEREAFSNQVRAVAARTPGYAEKHGISAPDLLDGLLTRNRDERFLSALRRLRYKLEHLGYRCHEVPYLHADPGHAGLSIVMSYTNAVMETRGAQRLVYMPAFRLPRLDRAATAVWSKLGFDVVPVDALGPAMNGGGIRCLSQVYRE